MDFKNISKTLSDSKGVPMQILSPDDRLLYAREVDGKWELTTEETEFPCELMMVGQDSKEFRERKKEMFGNRSSKSRRAMKFEDAEHEAIETVAAAVVGMHYVVWDGAILDHSTANLFQFLDEYRPAFEQANIYIADRSNFFQSASNP